MRRPTFAVAQATTSAVLFGSLAIGSALLFIGFRRHLYYSDEFKTLIFALGSLFAPHLALVIGVLLGASDGRKGRRVGAIGFATAISAIVLWSGLVLGRTWLFVTDLGLDDTTADLSAFYDELPQKYGFLLTGIVTYFFVKESQPTT
jgi:hypothetical protein